LETLGEEEKVKLNTIAKTKENATRSENSNRIIST